MPCRCKHTGSHLCHSILSIYFYNIFLISIYSLYLSFTSLVWSHIILSSFSIFLQICIQIRISILPLHSSLAILSSIFSFLYHLALVPLLSLSSFLHQTLYPPESSSFGSLNKGMMSYHTEITVTASTTSINSNNPYVYISPAPVSPAEAKREWFPRDCVFITKFILVSLMFKIWFQVPIQWIEYMMQ